MPRPTVKKEIRIANFRELHDVLSRYRESRCLFRGHSDPEWELVPKIGREPLCGRHERTMFEAWKRRAIEFVEFPPRDDWDWISIAQHHGLATRLLDWTFNPLAAAFFATRHHAETEAHIYVYHPSLEIRTGGPLDFEGIALYRPSAVASRIPRQGGAFTVHGPPTRRLDECIRENETLERIVIDVAYREQLLFDLDAYHVNSVSLFPNLDGLSAYANWWIENEKRWRRKPEDFI